MLTDAANAVRDVLRTVAQCHARNVLIRDVKPDNFLYLTSDENAPLKAIDFGLAQYCKADETLRDRAGVTQHAPQGLHTCLNVVQGCLFFHLIFLILLILLYFLILCFKRIFFIQVSKHVDQCVRSLILFAQ